MAKLGKTTITVLITSVLLILLYASMRLIKFKFEFIYENIFIAIILIGLFLVILYFLLEEFPKWFHDKL